MALPPFASKHSAWLTALAVATAPMIASAQGVAGAMQSATPGPSERLAAALGQIGMTACAGAVLRAANFLFEDGEANFIVQPLGPDANRWPTVITIEGAHAAQGRTRLTTLTVSPSGTTCAGFYEQVIAWPQSCASLQTSVFATFNSPRTVLRSVTVSELNAGVQLYLLPAASGAGCTSVKRELFR